jgi:cysteine desulfurase
MTPIYLDHNATTRPLPEVVEAVVTAMQDDYGNPSSLHWAGQDAVRTVDTGRSQVSKLLNCRADEITFTSGATEANTMVLRGIVEHHVRAGAKLGDLHIVTSAIEHSSVLRTLEDLQQQGLRVTYVAAGWDGRVNARQIEAAIEKSTILVTVMLANNDTGVIQPLEDIARFAHLKKVPVHSDITQAVGKIWVHPKTLELDFASLSAHKFQGPRGVGALWMRNGVKLLPLLRGGKQELNMRAGTENVPAIAGMGVASEIMAMRLDNYTQHCEHLRLQLQNGLLAL